MSNAGTSSANGQVEMEPDGAVARMARLKQYLAAHPERGIPELRLLHEEDWMDEALKADLDSEVGMRLALSQLRQLAQNQSHHVLAAALKAFTAAHGGQVPATPAQLAPFLERPEDADLLNLFTPYTGIARLAAPGGESWVFQERPSVDDWFDSETMLGANGSFAIQSAAPGFEVLRAMDRFVKATGIQPTDASQVTPYLTEPVSPAIVAAMVRGRERLTRSPRRAIKDSGSPGRRAAGSACGRSGRPRQA